MIARFPTYVVSGLTEKQQLAADCLAKGKSCRFAAQQAGVSERTLYAWRKRPQMQKEIIRLQAEMMDETGAQNLSMQQMALSTLNEILCDPDSRDSDKIAAARTLMTGSQAFTERKILERKLSDLENKLGLAVRGEEDGPMPELEESALVYAGSSEDDE